MHTDFFSPRMVRTSNVPEGLMHGRVPVAFLAGAVLLLLLLVAPVSRAGSPGSRVDYQSQVIAWGRNNSGQTNVPADLTNAVAVVGGAFFSAALKGDGTVVTWGGMQLVPPEVSNVVAIAYGYAHLLMLKRDGTVAAIGMAYLARLTSRQACQV